MQTNTKATYKVHTMEGGEFISFTISHVHDFILYYAGRNIKSRK
jgi:hypothetical protein